MALIRSVVRYAWPSLLMANAASIMAGCDRPTVDPAPIASATSTASAAKPAAPRFDAVKRARFNELALRENIPIYWMSDSNDNGAIDGDEVKSLLFYGVSPKYVANGSFTEEFNSIYARIQEADRAPAPSGSDAERQRLVIQDLEQGVPTLVFSDLSGLPADERAFVGHILEASHAIDELYAIQNGASALADQVTNLEPASQSLFRRNQGPGCKAPKTEKDPKCSSIIGAPKPVVDVYPATLQKEDPKFCAVLEKRPDAKKLFAPFVVVRGEGSDLEAVPYTEAYKVPMAKVAKQLSLAADALKSSTEEPLRTYLRAAATAFGDNNWEPADEAWAAMNAQNSKWYLRVAPDETYWEPCSQKAGFHLTFARINGDSLAWQNKLGPHQQAMEDVIAKLIGAPYQARTVKFHLPDFIDIVWNAGDDRGAIGATIGQSLPNWGPVANDGRGRTVAMSNLYTDTDSAERQKRQAATLLETETFKRQGGGADSSLLSTILHEATHNLGPAHEYAYQGKTDGEAFGGGLASMLEELKAQTGALYLLGLLSERGVITEELKERTYVDSLVWAFGHISRGMWTDTGERKAYSQLAAIQVGFLIDEEAIVFDATKLAQNGADKGAFTVDFGKLPAACEKLMQVVGVIKATNDRAGAEALAKKYIDDGVVPHNIITERFLRLPKASFVYAVDR